MKKRKRRKKEIKLRKKEIKLRRKTQKKETEKQTATVVSSSSFGEELSCSRVQCVSENKNLKN